MQWMNFLLGLALPVLTGAAWVALVTPPGTPGRPALVWGNGAVLGIMLTTLLLRLQDMMGLPLIFSTTAGLLFGMLLGQLCALYYRRRAVLAGPAINGHGDGPGAGERTLFVFFALLITLRIISLSLEVIWRPLFPWDATMHWATKARVWFDAASIVPFVDNRQWLEMAGNTVHTDHHPDYPISIPLVQLWMNIALGSWHESLMNVPWALYLAGLAGLFYGQGRAAGVAPAVAIAFTYMLVSMPLLDTHIALAGYGDILLGTCYCAALASFHNWSRGRQRGQAVLALFFAACCPLVKNEGLFWTLSLAPALVAALLPARRAVLYLLSAGLAGMVLLLLLPDTLVVAGHSLAGLDLQYRPGVWRKLLASLLIYDNWHLFGYLLVISVVLAPLLDRESTRALLPVMVAVGTALGLFLFLFLFTRFAYGAQHLTAVGRISLHLVPGAMFFLMLFYAGLLQRRRLPELGPAAAT